MAIPGFQDFMQPILHSAASGVVRAKTLLTPLADKFNLSAEERAQLIPSQRKTTLYDRISWAIYYLAKAGLLDKTSQWGEYAITDRGRTFLQSHPNDIRVKDLEAIAPDIRGRTTTAKDRNEGAPERDTKTTPASDDVPGESPEEMISNAYSVYKAQMIDSLLERVDAVNPTSFERLIMRLVEGLGYGIRELSQHVGGPGDGGVDGVICQDHFKLDCIYLQAKLYNPRAQSKVTPKDIQSFIGAIDNRRATKGIFVTSGHFTKQARETAEMTTKNIVLIDREELGKLMFKHNIGVQADPGRTYPIKDLDNDFFDRLDE